MGCIFKLRRSVQEKARPLNGGSRRNAEGGGSSHPSNHERNGRPEKQVRVPSREDRTQELLSLVTGMGMPSLTAFRPRPPVTTQKRFDCLVSWHNMKAIHVVIKSGADEVM